MERAGPESQPGSGGTEMKGTVEATLPLEGSQVGSTPKMPALRLLLPCPSLGEGSGAVGGQRRGPQEPQRPPADPRLGRPSKAVYVHPRPLWTGLLHMAASAPNNTAFLLLNTRPRFLKGTIRKSEKRLESDSIEWEKDKKEQRKEKRKTERERGGRREGEGRWKEKGKMGKRKCFLLLQHRLRFSWLTGELHLLREDPISKQQPSLVTPWSGEGPGGKAVPQA